MAAGDSPTSIANLALASLGEDAINTLNPPDNNKRARILSQLYDPIRRDVLALHPWRCAKSEASLAQAKTQTLNGRNAYPLPADFIRFYNEEGATDEVWLGWRCWELMNLKNVGPCVVTRDGPPLDIQYIFDLEDCTQMDAPLVMAVANALAAKAAMPLTRDQQIKTDIDSDREGQLSAARSVSAQQASPRDWADSPLMRSRW